MISLMNHDRVGRSTAAPLAALPSIDERAAISRQWAASAPSAIGRRREVKPGTSRRVVETRMAGAVAAVVDPVLDMPGTEGCDVEGLKAFARRMLQSRG